MANFFKRASTASLSFEHSETSIEKDRLQELFTDLIPDDETHKINIHLNELPDPPMNLLVALGKFYDTYSEKENLAIEIKVHPQTQEYLQRIGLEWFEVKESDNG